MAHRYAFGPFVLDVRDERLWKGATAVPLGGKALAVLARLLAHPNRLVTKDDLLSSVWPDTAVGEAVLTTAVREIRTAVGDDARAPRFVETAYGRGYRFIGRVECADEGPTLTTGNIPTPSPLVGRDPEWARLHELLADVRRRNQRRIVLIAGEAGIGKTTLVEAFTASVAGNEVWVGHGQCVDQYGAGEAYMPLLEALVRLGREQGPAITTLLHDHAPGWRPHIPAGDAAARRPSTPVRPERMLRELAQAVEAITAWRPLMLLLEDLQWSDRATLEWLAYVVRRRDPARLLVLGTYRPPATLLHQSPLGEVLPELRHQAQTTEVVLDYLTCDAVGQYVRQRCGDRPDLDALIDVLNRRTGGHPLFLAGLADDLVRRGGPTDPWRDRDAAASDIPSNVRQFIEDRIERLPHHERVVLEAASVVGEEFSVAAVAAATSTPDEEIEATCAAWAGRDRILVAEGTMVAPDGAVSARYRFRHALFQETCYQRISPERRAGLHMSIGTLLEAATGEAASPLAAELAVHFEEGRDYEKAVRYRERAARNAVRRSAYHDARNHLLRARALIERLPSGRDRLQREAACSLLLAQVLEALEGWGVENVRGEYTRARESCLALGDETRLLQATWGLIATSLVRAEYRRTQALTADLLRLARRRRDELFRMAAHTELGGTSLLLGRTSAARRHFDTAEALVARNGRLSGIDVFGMDMDVFTRSWATHVTWYVGYPDRARVRATESLKAAEATGHLFTQTIALAYAAMLAQFRGDRAEVLRLAGAAYAQAREHDFPYYRAWAEMLQAWALTGGHRGDHGIEEMRAAIAALQSSAGIRLPFYRALLAERYAAVGRPDKGLGVLAEVFEEIARTEERWWEAELYRIKGELLRGSTDRFNAEAVACFRTAMKIASTRRARALHLRAAIGLVRALRGTAAEANARADLKLVYDSFTEGFATADLQAARALLDS